MYNVKPSTVQLAVSEGGVPYTTYFADQEPIDGKLTVVDLTEGACRWPTGNPRDLNTFRYCGGARTAARIANVTRNLPICRSLPRAA